MSLTAYASDTNKVLPASNTVHWQNFMGKSDKHN